MLSSEYKVIHSIYRTSEHEYRSLPSVLSSHLSNEIPIVHLDVSLRCLLQGILQKGLHEFLVRIAFEAVEISNHETILTFSNFSIESSGSIIQLHSYFEKISCRGSILCLRAGFYLTDLTLGALAQTLSPSILEEECSLRRSLCLFDHTALRRLHAHSHLERNILRISIPP